MTLKKLVTILTKEAMIFSKMVDEIDRKFFEMHVKYSVAMKTSFSFNELSPIVQKYFVISKDSN